MKVTVCELPDKPERFSSAWAALVEHARDAGSEMVLLPEMPACPWFAHAPRFDEGQWHKALEAHEQLIPNLVELSPAAVLGTRPVQDGPRRLNQAFVWTLTHGYTRVHDKVYLPDILGWYERQWFHLPERNFSVAMVNGLTVGFLICTEVMFNEWARHYGRQGAHIIAVPRATGEPERWSVALRMAAIASGAFILSANRCGAAVGAPDVIFGGGGCVIAPDGTVIASTSEENPFVTMEIDPLEAVQAKDTYPRNVPE